MFAWQKKGLERFHDFSKFFEGDMRVVFNLFLFFYMKKIYFGQNLVFGLRGCFIFKGKNYLLFAEEKKCSVRT